MGPDHCCCRVPREDSDVQKPAPPRRSLTNKLISHHHHLHTFPRHPSPFLLLLPRHHRRNRIGALLTSPRPIGGNQLAGLRWAPSCALFLSTRTLLYPNTVSLLHTVLYLFYSLSVLRFSAHDCPIYSLIKMEIY